MVEIFTSIRHPNIFIERYSEEVKASDKKEAISFFNENYFTKKNLVAIVIIDDNAVMVEKEYIKVAAENFQFNKDKFSAMHIVGLKGIHKFFYKIFKSLITISGYRHTTENDIFILEKEYSFNFDHDFTCQYQSET